MTWILAGSELQPISFAGLSLTGTDGGPGDYSGEFMVNFDIAAQYRPEVVESEAEGQFPQYVRTDPDSKVIPLGVHLTASENTQAMIDALKKVFTPSRDIDYLRVLDADGNIRRMRVKSLGLAPWLGDDQYNYVASLEAPEPIWEDDIADVVFYNVSGNAAVSSKTWDITNSGNEECYPVVTLNAYANRAGVGNDWMMPIVIAWRSSLEGVDSQGLGYPIDLTDGAWDTSALADYTEAGVRAFLDGVEIDRYITNSGTTGTSVWASVPFQPARTATLSANITGSATSLTVTSPDDLAAFPDTGFILIDSECIAYRGTTLTGFSALLRGQRGTSVAGLHSAGADIYWVEHDIRLSWGGFSEAIAPGLSASDNQPILDLTMSSNLHHYYGTTDGLIAPTTLRPGQWVRELRAAANNRRIEFSSLGQTAGIVEFTDQAPTVDAPNFDSLSLYAPCFLSQNVTGVALEVMTNHTMAFDMFGVDAGGFESLLHKRDILGWIPNQGQEAGPIRDSFFISDNYLVDDPPFETIVVLPPDDLARVTLSGHSGAVTGIWLPPGYTNFITPDAGDLEEIAQVLSLNDKEPRTVTFAIITFGSDYSAYQGAGGGIIVRAGIADSDGPESPALNASTAITPLPAPAVAIAVITVEWGSLGNLVMKYRGTASVIFDYNQTTANSGVPFLVTATPRYSPGDLWEYDGLSGTWAQNFGQDMVTLAADGEGEPQPDCDLDTGYSVEVKNVHVYFNDAYTPLIVRGAVASAYTIYNNVLSNAQTGESITINCILPIDATQSHDLFKMDADGHVITILPDGTNGYEQPAGYAIEPTDIQHWLRLLPGVNTLTLTSGSAPRVAVKFYFRSRWT